MKIHLALRYRKTLRAAPGASVRHGKIENVAGSGFANISDSVTRANPSIAEPSKPIPSAKAFSNSAGAIATDFRKSQDIRKPQTDKANVALFQCAKDELLLLI